MDSPAHLSAVSAGFPNMHRHWWSIGTLVERLRGAWRVKVSAVPGGFAQRYPMPPKHVFGAALVLAPPKKGLYWLDKNHFRSSI